MVNNPMEATMTYAFLRLTTATVVVAVALLLLALPFLLALVAPFLGR
jgi:hypothetical protein